MFPTLTQFYDSIESKIETCIKQNEIQTNKISSTEDKELKKKRPHKNPLSHWADLILEDKSMIHQTC